MYVRMTRIQTPPDRIDAGIANFNEKVVPAARQAKGYQGAALLVNRETGDGVGVTYWDSLEALAASEQVGVSVRTQSAEATAARVIDVDRAELVIVDRAEPPRVPGYTRSISGFVPLENLDKLISMTKEKVVPELRRHKGYRSALLAVNRMTGRTLFSSNWATAQDRDATFDAMTPLREEAAKLTMAGFQVETFEAAAVEILQPSVSRN
jgi:heme-degrading monooxygenase HmoA